MQGHKQFTKVEIQIYIKYIKKCSTAKQDKYKQKVQ